MEINWVTMISSSWSMTVSRKYVLIN